MFCSRSNQHDDDYPVSTVPYNSILLNEPPATITDDFLQMDVLSPTAYNTGRHRFENTIEAKIEPGDTLQAIALRFHCTVADIKRLNKIDKENEIHARKVIKIPVTVHNVLLDNFPTVHKSGNNSPKPDQKSSNNGSRDSGSGLSSIVRNPLEDAEAMLSEKLLVASVNSSGPENPSTSRAAASNSANIALSSKHKSRDYTDEGEKIIFLFLLLCNYKSCSSFLYLANNTDDISAPLITDILDDSTNVPQLHRIRGPSLRAMDWSGSDCDMSWVCLFVVILALCFVIPLVYVFYIAEHAHHNTTHH